jgi:hypothetical protein
MAIKEPDPLVPDPLVPDPLVPDPLANVIKPIGKRCPKGTRRNKKGDCVSTVEKSMPQVAKDSTTHRPLSIPQSLPKSLPKPLPKTMDMFLGEKEKLERENILTGHDFLYPDLSDPNFNI